MRLLLIPACLALGFGLMSTGQAQAAGCVSGAAIGGVAGHVAGHHGVLGAAAGCAIGHHEANVNARNQAASTNNQQATPSSTTR